MKILMEINLSDHKSRKYYLFNGKSLNLVLDDHNFFSFFQLFYNLIDLQKKDLSKEQIEKYFDVPDNRVIFLLYIKNLNTNSQHPLNFYYDFLSYIKNEMGTCSNINQFEINKDEINLDFQLQKLDSKFIRDKKIYIIINDLRSLIKINFELIKLQDIRLFKCKICNCYYINDSKRQTSLCRYKHIAEASCSYKQAQKNARMKLESDELLKKYQQQYKRIYMRVDRAINKSKQNTNIYTPANLESFQEWSQTMAETMKRYLDEEIGEDEFTKLLKELEIPVQIYNDKLILG